MDLAVELGITALEIRTAGGRNALCLSDEDLRRIRDQASDRGLRVAALASPLWKWCHPDATPGRVDSFGFPTRVAPAERRGWVERAIEVAGLLGAEVVRVFSHLRVEPGLTERFDTDPLLVDALRWADRAGVRLLVENEPVCTVATAERLLGVLERHHADGLGLWLDIGNLHEVGDATTDTIAALAPYVGYVHVKDFRCDDTGGRVFCAAGTGDVAYTELVPVLDAVRPGLPYGLETHVKDTPAQALTSGAGFVRDLLARR